MTLSHVKVLLKEEAHTHSLFHNMANIKAQNSFSSKEKKWIHFEIYTKWYIYIYKQALKELHYEWLTI